jgi:hypothetical protein
VTEIVLPDPPPPATGERAHTCEGWIEVARGERPTCERCAERLARYRQTAAGDGTVAEIREALSALDKVSRETPLGVCVRVDYEGIRVWACPRSFLVEGEPLVSRAPNRRARRAAKLAKAKGRP